MGWKSILGIPACYRLFKAALSGHFGRRAYVRDYLRPKAGDRVLDIGCGLGDVLEYLPDVDYLGLDLSPKYVESARARFGSRGQFLCRSVEELVIEEPASFDIVMANGVVHHLDDTSAIRLYNMARVALKPEGRFVAIDGTFAEGQSPLARILVKNDRGKFVRTSEGYATLASQVFPNVKVSVRHDLLRVPYTHAILECSNKSESRRHGAPDRPAASVQDGAAEAGDRP
jgi:SAM-dependent methyltransferase